MFDPDWKNTLLDINKSIKDAIVILNDSGRRIVLVVSKEGYFEGSVTDGDIRRGLIHGLDLDSPITSVINRDAIKAPINSSEDSLIELMDKKEILQIPLVNSSLVVEGLYLRILAINDHILNNTLVLMAGGVGSRLRPRTETCPKPLLKVRGKPILQHVIESAKASGIRNIIISVNYLGYMIKDFFGNGEKLGVRISYITEDKALGTAGALSLIDPPLEEPLIITNGDLISDIDFRDFLNFHLKHNSSASMAVKVIENKQQFGVVKTKGFELVGFEEKPIIKTQVNAGVYVLNPEALAELKYDEKCDMPILFDRIIQKKKKALAYLIYESWTDVGIEDDFKKVNQ